jgi:hypothetical protein
MPSESTHRGGEGDTARARRKDSRALGLSPRTSMTSCAQTTCAAV